MMLPSLLLTRFRGWVQRSFLRSGGYQGCPGTGCEYAFRSNTATPTVGATSSSRRGSKSAGKASGAEPPMWVWCLCGHSWCAECRRPAHFPLSCSLSLSYYQADAVKELRDGFQVSLTSHYYPSLFTTICHSPLLSTHHYYPALFVTLRHYTSRSIAIRRSSLRSLTLHHYPLLSAAIHHYRLRFHTIRHNCLLRSPWLS
jgi:hypothetical protein